MSGMIDRSSSSGRDVDPYIEKRGIDGVRKARAKRAGFPPEEVMSTDPLTSPNEEVLRKIAEHLIAVEQNPRYNTVRVLFTLTISTAPTDEDRTQAQEMFASLIRGIVLAEVGPPFDTRNRRHLAVLQRETLQYARQLRVDDHGHPVTLN